MLNGVFYGKDLVAGVSGPLAKSLPFGLAGREGQGRGMNTIVHHGFGHAPQTSGSFQVREGGR